ncbi:hypothetical protein VOLCADRAFT_90869 [Volvox carteri f. nagariensis]|uniref:Uncharacterized protein n=1 Tax=Volvox carteri f. nagariensis TaxID=3068 RepID=D8TVA0_VOLCA|nr:uncharacterized protein VOLCADRAFT_90869 [Volvox carteri f. nagariensis]EFJ48539.1 hypothetical protein VOLCADRAFT_90869 [Volvox carteri f. nagariensis]|eukprot:XP_002950338.1 hypothetical protein VOLCADRAFT_90869 [Volvox carteri f. nagariensis]
MSGRVNGVATTQLTCPWRVLASAKRADSSICAGGIQSATCTRTCDDGDAQVAGDPQRDPAQHRRRQGLPCGGPLPPRHLSPFLGPNPQGVPPQQPLPSQPQPQHQNHQKGNLRRAASNRQSAIRSRGRGLSRSKRSTVGDLVSEPDFPQPGTVQDQSSCALLLLLRRRRQGGRRVGWPPAAAEGHVPSRGPQRGLGVPPPDRLATTATAAAFRARHAGDSGGGDAWEGRQPPPQQLHQGWNDEVEPQQPRQDVVLVPVWAGQGWVQPSQPRGEKRTRSTRRNEPLPAVPPAAAAAASVAIATITMTARNCDGGDDDEGASYEAAAGARFVGAAAAGTAADAAVELRGRCVGLTSRQTNTCGDCTAKDVLSCSTAGVSCDSSYVSCSPSSLAEANRAAFLGRFPSAQAGGSSTLLPALLPSPTRAAVAAAAAAAAAAGRSPSSAAASPEAAVRSPSRVGPGSTPALSCQGARLRDCALQGIHGSSRGGGGGGGGHAPEADPRQLMRAIVDCRHWRQLHAVFREYGTQANVLHLAAALGKMTRMHLPPPPPPPPPPSGKLAATADTPAAQAFLSELEAKLRNHLLLAAATAVQARHGSRPPLGPRQLATCLAALARLRADGWLVLEDLDLLQLAADISLSWGLESFPPQMSTFLWAIATLHHPPGQAFMDLWIQAAVRAMAHFSAYDLLSTALWCCVRLRVPPRPVLLQHLLAAAARRAPEFTPPSASLLLYALARLHYLGWLPAEAWGLRTPEGAKAAPPAWPAAAAGPQPRPGADLPPRWWRQYGGAAVAVAATAPPPLPPLDLGPFLDAALQGMAEMEVVEIGSGQPRLALPVLLWSMTRLGHRPHEGWTRAFLAHSFEVKAVTFVRCLMGDWGPRVGFRGKEASKLPREADGAHRRHGQLLQPQLQQHGQGGGGGSSSNKS